MSNVTVKTRTIDGQEIELFGQTATVKRASEMGSEMLAFQGDEYRPRYELSCEHVKERTGVHSVFLAKLFFNDFQMYGEIFFDEAIAIRRLAEMAKFLRGLPFKLRDRKDVDENLVDRPVYYREHPAVIESFDGMTGNVLLRSTEEGFPMEPWLAAMAGEGEVVVKDFRATVIIDSPQIHWYRLED